MSAPRFLKMVGWYDPFQLVSTAVDVAVSSLVGLRSDYRLLEALGGAAPKPFEYVVREDGLWLDYVADLGDGWNPTYAVASLLARESLVLKTSDGEVRTRRGDVVIMGGDEVYPTAGRDAYRDRTEAPYRSAFRGKGACPDLFAIPGNHDWYDGLVAFSRTFCQGRFFGGLKTKQERSYFALRLPAGWWLLGVDVQLESDIDRPQLEYFRGIAGQMNPGDNVILCTPEPEWIYGKVYSPSMEKNLAYLEEVVATASGGATIRLRLAGDLHHYRRHESAGGVPVHNVIAGGGGAFLHPTHSQRVTTFTEQRPGGRTYSIRGEYPAVRTSGRLAWKNLLFPFVNPRFGILTAIAYLLLSWSIPHKFSAYVLALGSLPGVVEDGLAALATEPGAAALIVLVVLAFVAFTDTHKPWYRWVAGTLHALTHLAAAMLAAWVADRWSAAAGLLPGTFNWFAATSAIVAGLAYFIGAWVMGVYLFISVNVFGRHSNEAFSSLRIQDYKCFVRMHIAAGGMLTLYAIGIDRVPRRWRRSDEQGPEWVATNRELTARLIDVVHVGPGQGRVAQPFGFALADPSVRLSRTRLFPRVTEVMRREPFEER